MESSLFPGTEQLLKETATKVKSSIFMQPCLVNKLKVMQAMAHVSQVLSE